MKKFAILALLLIALLGAPRLVALEELYMDRTSSTEVCEDSEAAIALDKIDGRTVEIEKDDLIDVGSITNNYSETIEFTLEVEVKFLEEDVDCDSGLEWDTTFYLDEEPELKYLLEEDESVEEESEKLSLSSGESLEIEMDSVLEGCEEDQIDYFEGRALFSIIEGKTQDSTKSFELNQRSQYYEYNSD